MVEIQKSRQVTTNHHDVFELHSDLRGEARTQTINNGLSSTKEWPDASVKRRHSSTSNRPKMNLPRPTFAMLLRLPTFSSSGQILPFHLARCWLCCLASIFCCRLRTTALRSALLYRLKTRTRGLFIRFLSSLEISFMCVFGLLPLNTLITTLLLLRHPLSLSLSLQQVYDCLLRSSLSIVGKIGCVEEHCLIGTANSVEEV